VVRRVVLATLVILLAAAGVAIAYDPGDRVKVDGRDGTVLSTWTEGGQEHLVVALDATATPTPSPEPTPTATPEPTPTATPEPTPTPEPSGDCLASENCYPKPANSGPGATGVPPFHAPAAGCTANPASGTVLTDCLFTGIVDITTTGSGATYRFSEFRGQIRHRGTGTLTVELSTFGPTSGCNNDDNAFTGSNYTVRNSRFNSHLHEGPRDAGSNILIEENFIGPICSGPGDHADGIQGYGGGTNVLVRHNTIDMRTAQDVTSAIFMADSSESARVEDNLVMGGGYTIRLHDDFTPDHGPWTLIRNRLVDGAWTYGPMNNALTTFTSQTCVDNRAVTIDGAYEITSSGRIIGC
jgi:hypothetical protein